MELFSSNPGGFSVIINGITIHTEKQVWDDARDIISMLDMFEDYANATNNPCDAEVDSYDAMVLFTGRADDLVQRGESTGIAKTGALCKIAPVIMLTMRLNKTTGAYEANAPKLLAHELGHLFGAYHDGVRVDDIRKHNPYQFQYVPCPSNVNIMSPVVPTEAVLWSECTRHMVDGENKRRQLADEDCLFT